MALVSGIRFVVALAAAGVFANAGYNMNELQSQAGNTVAEIFDHAMGLFSYGMALLSLAYALGIGTAIRAAGAP